MEKKIGIYDFAKEGNRIYIKIGGHVIRYITVPENLTEEQFNRECDQVFSEGF